MTENNMPFIFQAAACNDRRHVGRGEAAGAGWAGRGGGGWPAAAQLPLRRRLGLLAGGVHLGPARAQTRPGELEVEV